jgi:hypothetical protein
MPVTSPETLGVHLLIILISIAGIPIQYLPDSLLNENLHKYYNIRTCFTQIE